MSDHIKITKKITLMSEIEDTDQADYDNIVDYLLKDYDEGGTEQLRKTLHENFVLDSEGAIAVRALLFLIEKIDVPTGNTWL